LDITLRFKYLEGQPTIRIVSKRHHITKEFGKIISNSKFPRSEKEILDDLMAEILEEMIQVKPCDPLPEDKVLALQIYVKETLGLDREVLSFSHKLQINIKRPPKLQLLFDLIREASETSRVLSETGINGIA
jgi:hypothetical protein